MMIDQVRDHFRADPFRPFLIHLADGRRITVLRREWMAMSPNGRSIAVCQADDHFDLLAASQITGVEPKDRT